MALDCQHWFNMGVFAMMSLVSPRYRAVVFDLFGTLVDAITGPPYRAVHERMAETLSIPYDRYIHMMHLTHYSRSVGRFNSWEANIEHICRELGVQPGGSAIRLAARMRNDYAKKLMMTPKAGVLEALQQVKERGFKTGLISDCTPDEPEIWSDTPLAPLFDVAVFSTEAGLKKADPRIYELALRRLEVEADECVYIGDGGSDELHGAERVGMHAVLTRADAVSAEAYAAEWAQWEGDAVSSLSEVLPLLGWPCRRTQGRNRRAVNPDDWFYTLDDAHWLRPDEEGRDRDEAAFIKSVLGLREGQTILDAPCGAGRVAVHLAKMGCRVMGVDLRLSFIKRAQERFLREGLAGQFLVMDLRALPFSEEFDAVCNWGGSFGYFTDAENVDVLRRYARALRPGGRIVIDQINREGILRTFAAEAHLSERMIHLNRWDRKTQRVITERILDGRNDPGNMSSMRLYTPRQMERLFRQAGLEVEEVHGSLSGNAFRRSSRRMYVVGRKK